MNALTQGTTLQRQSWFGARARLILTLLVTLFIALSINNLLAIRAQRQDLLQETDRRGAEVAHYIAGYLAYSVAGHDDHALGLLLRDLIKRGDIVYARVDDTRGDVVVSAGTDPGDGTTQSYTEHIRLNDQLLGRLTLRLSTQHVVGMLESREHEVLLRQMLTILAALLAVTAALSVFVIRPFRAFSDVFVGNRGRATTGRQRLPLRPVDEFEASATRFISPQDSVMDTAKEPEFRLDLADRDLRDAYQKLATRADALREMNRELEQLAITDPLTGLYNRRYFEKQIESEVMLSIRNDETISILLLDIDRFRDINDRHGQDIGDQVIRSVAGAIADRARPAHVACRYDGDQFVILCRRATISNAVSMADDLQRVLQEMSLPVPDHAARVTVSIGVATIPGVYRVSTAEELFHCAKEALRHAKHHNTSGGVVHFSMLQGGKFGAP
jgi:diguanylate cyclase (GGDEF)-like protein